VINTGKDHGFLWQNHSKRYGIQNGQINFFKDKHMKWYENESFWQTFGVVLFNDTKVEDAKNEVKQLLDLVSIPHHSKILDLGCGVGRHAIELSLLGFDVYGLDQSRYLLQKAKEAALKKQANVSWVHNDMRNLSFKSQFETVMSLWTSFGYFEAPEDNTKVLDNVFLSLKNGGKFIMELITLEAFERNREPVREFNMGEYTLIETSLYKAGSRKNRFTWTLLKNGKVQATETVSHWLYSSDELVNSLKSSGFKKVKTYGSLSGAKYDDDSHSLVLVSIK